MHDPVPGSEWPTDSTPDRLSELVTKARLMSIHPACTTETYHENQPVGELIRSRVAFRQRVGSDWHSKKLDWMVFLICREYKRGLKMIVCSPFLMALDLLGVALREVGLVYCRCDSTQSSTDLNHALDRFMSDIPGSPQILLATTTLIEIGKQLPMANAVIFLGVFEDHISEILMINATCPRSKPDSSVKVFQVITPDSAEATLARSHTLTFEKLWIMDNLKDEVNRKDKIGHEGEQTGDGSNQQKADKTGEKEWRKWTAHHLAFVKQSIGVLTPSNPSVELDFAGN
jgi:hypothetical protein